MECDCAWNDQLNPSACREFDEDGEEVDSSRYSQMLFWEGRRTPPRPNGDVNVSLSYNDSPSDMEWYANVSSVCPDTREGGSAAASEHDTAYDRL